MQTIATENAPKAIGPYSQAVLAGGMLFISGQLGMNPETGAFRPDFVTQAEQVFLNLQGILEAAGLSFANVVKVSVFLKDMNDFATLNAVYARFFREPYPAREAIEVARLPKDGLIEISLIAMKGTH